jgi:hypothetical protein
LPAAIEQHGETGAGGEAVGLGEGFADEHLAAAAGLEPATGSQVEPVEHGGVEVREGSDHAAGGFIEPFEVECHLDGDIGLDDGDAGDGAEAWGEGFGGAFQVAEDLGEPVGFVVFAPGGIEGLMRLRAMMSMARPQAMTTATAMAWPFMRPRSRTSLRSRWEIIAIEVGHYQLRVAGAARRGLRR